MKPLDRLLYAQGNRCFFCREPLARSDASIEHLNALANNGSDSEENRVACCKALNSLLGSKSLKGKIEVVLNQDGKFRCPNGPKLATQVSSPTKSPSALAERLSLVVENLKARRNALPKTIKTLTTTIAALFKPKLTGEEVATIVQELQSAGRISVNGSKITYL